MPGGRMSRPRWSCHKWFVSMLLVLASAMSVAGEAQETPRFYCDRTALTAEQKVEIRTHGRVLRDAVTGVRELPNGFEFQLKPDDATYRALVAYIPLEHACCPFFDFGVRLAPAGTGLTWSLTGAPGVKEFIKEELDWLFKAAQ